MRRTILHQKMVERAEACGVTLLWNTPVAGLSRHGVIRGEKLMNARWIIGADGIHSRVRRWIDLDSNARVEKRFAQRKHFRVKPWTDCMEIHWGNRAQAYVTPLSNEETCVALISRDPRMRFEHAWRLFPRLSSYLRYAESNSAERGAVTVTRKLSQVYRGNVALTGDASGSVDAITGEGLCLSFHQAIVLADALVEGDLSHYQAAHARLSGQPGIMARALLLLDRHPALRRRVVRTLSIHPELFSRLLAMHAGASSPAHVLSTGTLLGWRLVTA